MFELYTTPRSANGRKPLAAAQHLGLSPVVHTVDVYAGEGQSPEFRAINPLGKVPALVDGELRLAESNAILVYLDEAYGSFRLTSLQPARKAEVLRWLFWESAHWQPALVPVLRAHVGHALLPAAVPVPTAAPDWEDAELAPLLRLLDQRLARRDWLAGPKPSLADFSVGGMTTYFRHCDFPAARWPALGAWLERLDALPAWKASEDPLWA